MPEQQQHTCTIKASAADPASPYPLTNMHTHTSAVRNLAGLAQAGEGDEEAILGGAGKAQRTLKAPRSLGF